MRTVTGIGSMRTEKNISALTDRSDADSDAKFLGWQKTKSGEPVALYNITAAGHPSYGSTVSEKSLEKMNLEIPETPPRRTSMENL